MKPPARAAFLRAIRAEIDALAGPASSDSCSPIISTPAYHTPRIKCRKPLFDIKAKPWTDVTDDNRLVSHLISSLFTWEQNFSGMIEQESFINAAIAGDLSSPFCSPLLVNAMLANACRLYPVPNILPLRWASDVGIRCTEACRDGCQCDELLLDPSVTPDAIEVLGDRFLAKARALWDAEIGRSSLTNLQGVHHIHIR